jgi:hypothetical protein
MLLKLVKPEFSEEGFNIAEEVFNIVQISTVRFTG